MKTTINELWPVVVSKSEANYRWKARQATFLGILDLSDVKMKEQHRNIYS